MPHHPRQKAGVLGRWNRVQGSWGDLEQGVGLAEGRLPEGRFVSRDLRQMIWQPRVAINPIVSYTII